jgi:hypothetical protein
MTFPTILAEHVSNASKRREDRHVEKDGHVENVPHVRFGLSSET